MTCLQCRSDPLQGGGRHLHLLLLVSKSGSLTLRTTAEAADAIQEEQRKNAHQERQGRRHGAMIIQLKQQTGTMQT